MVCWKASTVSFELSNFFTIKAIWTRFIQWFPVGIIFSRFFITSIILLASFVSSIAHIWCNSLLSPMHVLRPQPIPCGVPNLKFLEVIFHSVDKAADRNLINKFFRSFMIGKSYLFFNICPKLLKWVRETFPMQLLLYLVVFHRYGRKKFQSLTCRTQN